MLVYCVPHLRLSLLIRSRHSGIYTNLDPVTLCLDIAKLLIIRLFVTNIFHGKNECNGLLSLTARRNQSPHTN